MELLDEEEFELPLFTKPLARLNSSFEPLAPEQPVEQEEFSSGVLKIKETAADSGITTITVRHHHKGESVGRYRFDVMDYDQRTCRYHGNDTPPWPIYWAVTRYGYHCQTSPESQRKHTFDLVHAGIMELLARLQDQEYEYVFGWGTRVVSRLWFYLHLAAFEYQVGPENMERVLSIIRDNHSPSALPIDYDDMKTVVEEFDLETPFTPHSEGHPGTFSLSEDDPQPAEGSNDTPIRATFEHRGRGEQDDILYVELIGSDAIDRFSFHITDEEEGTCVAQTNVNEDYPPYIVIERVMETYEITNLPKFTAGADDSPLSQFLVELDRGVRRVTKLVSPDSRPTDAALDDYISTLEVFLTVLAAYEVAPDEYDRGVREAFANLGIDLSVDNITRLQHRQLDQITVAAFQAVDDSESIQEYSRELKSTTNTENRRRQSLDDDPDVDLLRALHDTDISIH